MYMYILEVYMTAGVIGSWCLDQIRHPLHPYKMHRGFDDFLGHGPQ